MIKSSILLYSGNYFDFENIESNKIEISDIAHGLSNVCRFAGQCPEFYSVAQHSVLVSQLLPPHLQLQGLLHDASEAYMGDVAKPLKNLLPDYVALEKRVEAHIFESFGLPSTLDYMVKNADMRLLRTEQRDIMRCSDDWYYSSGVAALDEEIVPLSSKKAEELFLDQYLRLTK